MSRRRWRSLLRAAVALPILIGVAAAVAGEALAWAWPQDFATLPANHWVGRIYVGAFFARVFQFHVAIGVLVGGLLLLALRWWRSALMVFMAAGVLLMPYLRDYAPKSSPRVAGPTLRVMAMNLFFRNTDVEAIVRAIDDADPDVIVMPEATTPVSQVLIYKRLLKRYPHVSRPSADGSTTLISRVPFRPGSPIPGIDPHRPHVPLIFDLGGQEISIYGVHLVSPGKRTYRLMGREIELPGSDWLVRHNRAQTQDLASLATLDPRPIVIAGDFNFPQLSPNYRYLRSVGFRSSHDLVGFGLGNTWGPKWSWMNKLPGVRIDHILVSPHLTAATHRIGLDSGSDHRPVVADIGFVE